MEVVDIVFVIGFVASVFYLADFYVFARRLRTYDAGVWRSIGSPVVTDVNGLGIYLAVILGFKARPVASMERYRARMVRLRIMLFIGMIAYGYIFFRSVIN